ncbi:hypothetical protein EFT87_15165 [Schleiferilactobacillus harbinensis]|uniref:hypothetical protein n=1 Tax=Schleiferilactobacillus harbinensis TaxID=304207 RepID=UPI0021A57B36|nr:hypothetical protein [Schleiferilactobacillus harbinensis]MCT2909953.1 hypothetical protein [Schleiferilactobacillus harbinensis]
MERQIEELIRLLNQGVKHLPESINVVVQQYAMQRFVDAGFEFVLSVTFIVAALILVVKWYKQPIDTDSILDTRPNCWMGVLSAISGVVGFVLLLASEMDFSKALSPVYSLIKSLR